jgi:hypothetical protein
MRWGVVGVLVLLLIAAAVGVYWQGRQLYVEVVNDSGEPLKDVRISYAGGEFSTGRLEPGGRWKERIRPTEESDLEIVVWDRSAARHVQKGDVSFEPGQFGTMRVEIGERYESTVTGDVK